jgi:hypothetical protein
MVSKFVKTHWRFDKYIIFCHTVIQFHQKKTTHPCFMHNSFTSKSFKILN